MQELKDKIRTVPNWPKPGIMFRDITTLIKDPAGFKQVLDLLYERYKDMPIDKVVAIESRGFIFGSVLADRLGVGFVPIRKKGKLPADTLAEEYDLEYGKDKIEIHIDAIEKNEKILLVDDLIATGGTALAACNLLKKAGGEIVECVFVIDLPDLKGSKKLNDLAIKTFSLIQFEGE
ncbi:MAG: adenine phosphoribosyltransferase [Candidatus Staskawiczbacteria bacterium]|nr:adenine phosphoribosyltransferase [Candidatus Staskawiczbacteria bacterium]